MSISSSASIYAQFATSDGEAAKRYGEHQNFDPFPDVAPALLNFSDIGAYIKQTGMVFPFNPRAKHKSASIAIKLQGRVIYWDESGKHDFILSHQLKEEYPKKYLGKGHDYKQSLTLRKNSIAFVTLEPKFRLPNYIAARFNLKIKDVYRGLLLGTGPLVDPGYSGYLSIPLHNLTFNDYEIPAGEEIAWMEFTKVSSYSEWHPSFSIATDGRFGMRPEFPREKNQRKDVQDYLEHALSDERHKDVGSSIPREVSSVKLAVARLKKFGFFAAIVGMIGIIIGALALVGVLYAAMQYHVSQIDLIRQDVNELKMLIAKSKE